MTNVPTVPTYVVGIGASAGGLDAIERFFDNVPKQTSMAFVLVQHLSPDFKSLMDELLARHTPLPIHLVEDGMAVEGGHVYLIPPKKEMIISDGRLLLSDRDRQQELTLPIDLFFRSLARDAGIRAVAVVLSGSGSDGSRGIRDVHDVGGLVLAQDSESAQFDGMPRMARDSGFAHFVLPPEEMPRVLAEHESAGSQRPSQAPRADGAEPTGIGHVYRMLQEEFGIDFTHYKPSTVTRRIERRLTLARSLDLEEYVRRLKEERAELDVLYQDLLIGVTRFFRDEEAFNVLEHEVLPELFQREPRDTPFRVWVAGCATGEEAYSFAIVLQDLMRKFGDRPVKIFATDVHRGSLERATRGLYGADAVRNVSEERLARYFTRVGESWQIVPDLRQMLVFAQHNVIKDAPFTRVDLVSCRNLLIYLQPAAQHKILSLFHFALNRGGALFLGPSESAGPLAPGFENVDKHWRLYRKQNDARLPAEARLPPFVRTAGRGTMAPYRNPSGRYTLAQLLGTYEAVLGEVMPPSLLVSERGELLHSFGGANEFLRRRDGRQGLDVLDLVDPGLKLVLVGGLKRAIHERSAVVYRNVRIADALYAVTVRPIPAKDGDGHHLLVSIEPPEPVEPEARIESPIELDQASHEQLRMLDAELNHTRESLQSAIEELEASNEELQASNEELQASNEELQSTNEELQSVNEELYTVNAEYQRKITELTELTNDMDNLLSSTEIGTIFLDKELNIRKFTPQIADTFNLVPHDVGRSIETFAYRMDHPELVDDLKRVIATEAMVERELRGVRGKSFFLRILPYRARGSVDGVVLTLIDVSGLKAAEDALFHERYLFNSLLANVPDAIYFKDARGRFIRANPAMASRLGLEQPSDAVGKTGLELPDRKLGLMLHEMDEAVLRTGEAQYYKLERRAAASERWDLVTRLPLRDENQDIVGIVVVFRDVTDQKRAEAKIQEAVRRRDHFLAMLSHELRNPLGAIVTATALLKNDGAGIDPKTQRFVEVLDRQSHQMARLLDDLLEASRVTQNMIDLRKRPVDLRTVVKDAAEAVRGQMDAHGIEFTLDIDGPPLHIDGDPARLQQIHVNLLNNAAKYTPKGGHVRFSAKREGDTAVIRVRDDGAGIPAEMLDSVFDLFVQAQNTLDRSAGGLGVGLTLVRSLVTMHGGTVVAESDGEGAGTEVVVRLPCSSTPLETKPSRRSRPIVRTSERVVVVEDNPDSREMLCRLLEGAGFDCHSTDSGTAAIKLIAEIRPDIAVLDIGLPGMDGFEIARWIRARPEYGDMRLVALTGYGQATDRATASEAGFDAHVVKPVHPDELVRLLVDLRKDGPRSKDRRRPDKPDSGSEPHSLS